MTTKTIKTILFVGLIAAMILPFSGMMMAEAAPIDNANKKTPLDSMKILNISEFDGIAPGIINENALNDLKIAVAKNPKVKGLLGNNYEFTDTAQRLTENDGWQPILNYYTDDSKYTVTVVMDKGKVVSAEKYENVVWGHANGYAIDQYDDDRYTVSGMMMLADIPDYNHAAGSFTVLLLNAQKTGSDHADVCDSTKSPTSYWAQIGMQFDANGVRVGYTDTLRDCIPAFYPIPYNTGDSMQYRIYIDESTDVWTLWVNNKSNADPPYAFSRTVSGSSTLDFDTNGTSVFWENANTSSNGWDAGFASDPDVDYAAFQWTNNNNYYYWGVEDQIPVGCDAGTIAEDLMSGTFVGSPHDVTFDVSGIEDNCVAQ